ncbi:hypothetical protein [Pontibacter mangrovi]|uniref:DUF3945 domain-containing protein n=1 Tax=Pontibacter mangrovi TaxID=2589816 RepID=A0A501W5A1_9BACT|nr:hypothetical protein [Pontibacter mangrovi]TPE42421.1 hypothetical protein FJM65_18540 [Pontibacter mangrovi]
MNTENFDYLKNELKYTGFGEQLYGDLEQQLQRNEQQFQLHLPLSYLDGTVHYTLHFRRSDQTDRYYFNKYEATLTSPELKEDRRQTFYINRQGSITTKEAYNLLQGRAVYKELLNAQNQLYKAWLQLDLKMPEPSGNYKINQYHENYGYDLEKTLQAFQIKELQDAQQKELLLYALRKGNQPAVIALENGTEAKCYIEACPRYKTINVFNEQRQAMMRETIQRQDQTVELEKQQQATLPAESLKEKVQKRKAGKKKMVL